MTLHGLPKSCGVAVQSRWARARALVSAAPARFATDETGTITVFGLTLMLLMVMIGGIAVDVMRYEARRTALQNTLDRSTLAAASLTQDLDPTGVVNDYFLKAGLLQNLTSVTVTTAINGRKVTATAAADSDPLFMHLVGVDKLDAKGLSTAEQRINNVEIMLVLDVSGSMKDYNKLTNLKNAAKQFVTSMLTNDIEHKVSIGIVPFNGQVNLGTALASKFNLTDWNGLPSGPAIQPGVACVDLPPAAYTSYAVPTTMVLSMTSNVDTGSTSTPLDVAWKPDMAWKWCPDDVLYTGNPKGTGGNIVRLPQQDIATLQGYINGMNAIGSTSINAGMKWGMTLLDDSAQPIYTSAISAKTMPATMAGRPLSYDTPDAMKVIVLMTDGENYAEERVNPAYKTGTPTMIWQSNADGKWSVFNASKVDTSSSSKLCSSRPFWVPTANAWQSRAWNGSTPSGSACYVPATSTSGAVNRTWQEIWAALPMKYVAHNFYVKANLANSVDSQLALFRTKTGNGNDAPFMDTQLQTACSAAKANNVIVYGIAFGEGLTSDGQPKGISSNGQAQIRNCTTDSEHGSHYFVAAGIQISSAFAAIAKNISQLRLTQ